MRKTLILLRKGAVMTGIFAYGYYLGHTHAMTNPDEVKFRRIRKEAMARADERRQEKLVKKYRKKDGSA